MLYIAIVRSKLEYTSIVWKCITNTDSNKLQRIQRKFAALCHNMFFQDIGYHYINTLDTLNLQTLYVRWRHIDAPFLIDIFRGSKSCPLCSRSGRPTCSYSEYPNFSMFSCSSSHSPTARCVSDANSVRKFVDIFSNPYLSLKGLLWPFFLFFLSCLHYVFCFVCCIIVCFLHSVMTL
jgi:hypothetical protein